MSKHIGIHYLYRAQLAFVEISSGIYKVGKDRLKIYGPGRYVHSSHVTDCLRFHERVVICKDSLDTVIHANFEMDHPTSTELKKMYEEEIQND